MHNWQLWCQFLLLWCFAVSSGRIYFHEFDQLWLVTDGQPPYIADISNIMELKCCHHQNCISIVSSSSRFIHISITYSKGFQTESEIWAKMLATIKRVQHSGYHSPWNCIWLLLIEIECVAVPTEIGKFLLWISRFYKRIS